MSLSRCLRKLADVIDPNDVALVKQYAKDLRSDGMTGDNAAMAAAHDVLKELFDYRQQIGEQIAAQGGEMPSRTDMESTLAEAVTVDTAAQEAATSPENDIPEPTDAQKEAGNYKMGHVSIETPYGPLNLTIENPIGSQRSNFRTDEVEKVMEGLADADQLIEAVANAKVGQYDDALTDLEDFVTSTSDRDKAAEVQGLLDKYWASTMTAHYGYAPGSKGKDGDEIDFYIHEGHDGTLNDDDPVFIINQVGKDGEFDEHKVMVGWNVAADAKAGYLAHYETGWTQGEDIRQTNAKRLMEWLGESRSQVKNRRFGAPVEDRSAGTDWEQWWRGELTPYGRELAMKAAGVTKSDGSPYSGRIMWRHLTANNQAKLQELWKGGWEPTNIDVEGQQDVLPTDNRGVADDTAATGEPATTGQGALDLGEQQGQPDGGSGSTGDGGTTEGQPTTLGLFEESGAPTSAAIASAGNRDQRPAPNTKPARERVKATDYRITADDNIGAGGLKKKAQQNVDAIRLLKEIEERGGGATAAEQAILAKYVGWGGMPNAFRDRGNVKSDWKNIVEELESLLTEEELAAARASTPNAHYTSETVTREIWSALEALGFTGGHVLEPGMGVGNFFGMMPDSVRQETQMHGVEMDNITGRIAQQLYPGQDVRIAPFQDVTLPDNFFDAVIGNVPFDEQTKPYDPVHNKRKLALHDYFMYRGIQHLKPGGVMAIISTKGTMDKQTQTFRELVSQDADLIGAIRLPDTAFRKNANTEVTTDILFIRKRKEGEPKSDIAWTKVKPMGPDEILVNEYYHGRGHMMLGEMTLKGTMYGANQPTLTAPDNLDLESGIRFGVRQIIDDQHLRWDPELEDNIEAMGDGTAPEELDEGSFFVDGDKLYVKEWGKGRELKPGEGINKTDQPKVRMLTELRDATREVLNTQIEDRPESEQQKAREKLNRLYDRFVKKYGLINDTKISSYVSKRTGKDVVQRRMKNLKAFRSDPDAMLVAALEDYNEADNTAEKAPIFTERVVSPEREIKQVDTVQDALLASLNQHNRVNLPYISALMGMPEEQVINELGSLIYNDPTEMAWTTADAYLSGNVRKKLAAAEMAAENDESYQRNVEALKEVQPEDLPPSQIKARLGAPWLTKEVVRDFVAELIGADPSQVQVGRSNKLATWTVRADHDAARSAAATQDWGTPDKNAIELIEATLNQKLAEVQYWDEESKSYKKHQEKSIAAQAKQQEIKDRFTGNPAMGVDGWVWQDADRAQMLARKYNDEFNNIRRRDFDGSHLTFTGMRAKGGWFQGLRKHQADAIWRIMQQGNTLLGHVVGAGKTMTMVGAGMEMKRVGLINKPMYVVPNHMLEQFARELLQLYPNAKVITASPENFHKDTRRLFIRKVATGNWDAVIITHSAFGKLPMSVESQDAYIKEEIAEWERVIKEAEAEGEEKNIVKRLEKRKSALEEKLEANAARHNKDKGISFEDTGVDMLFVDEAHQYKNLETATKMTGVKNLTTQGTQKTMDLMMKARYLDGMNPGRSLVFATGTPVSNSMVEMFTMQRYLQPRTLKEYGIEHFDSWAGAFGESVSALELDPTGGGYRVDTRFAKFVNVPELLAMFGEVADIKLASHLNLPVPKLKGGKPEVIEAKPTDEQKQYVQQLSQRLESLKGKRVEKGGDNALKVVGEGRHLALDQRTVIPGIADDPDSKVNKAVAEIHKIWKETKPERSTQLVFLDLSTPRDGFNVYDDMRAKLVARGIPEAEIKFMQDFDKPAKKELLFSDVRAGRVRVLFGSTQKMGVGTNVQKKLIALHEIDPPWRPADVEQRDGRALRQGNENEEIRIIRYVTSGTFDAYMWQTLDTKAKFINQVMAGDLTVREMEDIDDNGLLDSARIKAIASGNPKVMELAGLEGDIAKLTRLEAAHLDNQHKARTRVRDAESDIEYADTKSAAVEADIATRKIPDELSIKVGDKTYGKDDRKKAGDALIKMIQGHVSKDADIEGLEKAHRKTKSMRESAMLKDKLDKLRATLGTDVLGEYAGFPIEYKGYSSIGNGSVEIQLRGKNTWAFRVPMSDLNASGIVTRIENQASGMEKLLSDLENTREAAVKDVKEFRERIGKPFEQAEQLKQLIERAEQLRVELQGTASEETGPDVQTITDEEYDALSQWANEGGGNPGLYSRVDFSGDLDVNAVRDYLGKRLSKKAVKDILDSGLVTIVQTQAELPAAAQRDGKRIAGWVQPDRQRIWLVADNLTAKDGMFNNAYAVLAHEMGVHRGMRGMMTQKEWRAISDTVKSAMELGRRGRPSNLGRAAWAARQRVPNDTNEEHVMEETIAYLVQEQANRELPLVKRILAAIKNFLNRMGFNFALTPDMLAEMAKSAIFHQSRQRHAMNIPDQQAAASVFNPETERHPRGLNLPNIDLLPAHANLLADLGHDYALDNNGVNPVQAMGQYGGRVRVRLVGAEQAELMDYVQDYIDDKNRGANLPAGFSTAMKKLDNMIARAGHKWSEVIDTTNGKVYVGPDISLMPAGVSGAGVWEFDAIYAVLDTATGERIAKLIVGMDGDSIQTIYGLYSDAPRGGAGRRIVEALVANTDKPLIIDTIVDDARGFWQKMGAHNYVKNKHDGWNAEISRGSIAAATAGVSGQSRIPDARQEDSGRDGQGREDEGYYSVVSGDRIDPEGIQRQARRSVGDWMQSSRKFNRWWHKTVGTQFHKAQVDERFGRVFDKGQDFLTGVSRHAMEAEEKAPDLLFRMEGFTDIFKMGASQKDVEAIARPLYDGTLAGDGNPELGRIWSERVLRERYGLSDKQIRYYKQALAAVGESTNNLAKSVIYKLGRGDDLVQGRDREQELDDLAATVLGRIDDKIQEAVGELEILGDESVLQDQLAAMENRGASPAQIQSVIDEHKAATLKLENRIERFQKLRNDVEAVQEKAHMLNDHGYFPLMRFGEYTVYVTGEDSVTGEPVEIFFGMYESQAKANRAARALEQEYPDANVRQGILSQEAYKLFKGLSPETLSLFADRMGVGEDEVMQDFIRLTRSNRSAMKRLIHRKGMAGYSEDVQRTLATFVTSNARASSQNYHLGEMQEAIEAIPENEGDVKDEAIKLWQYLTDPREEAGALRGFLFFNFLGGSIASALVNATQPITMTLPYLNKYVNSATASAMLSKASMEAATGQPGRDVKAAYDRALEDGIIAPHEIHQLMATTRGAQGQSRWLHRFTKAWGGFFAMAEAFNRRTTFIAAYRIGVKRGLQNPYKFAEKAVYDTQGIYNKGNRPNWARGTVGATVFTFKQFSIAYLEFLKRLPMQQRLLAMAILTIAAGLEGWPFADDLDDIADTIGQWLGHGTNTKRWRRETAARILGEDVADWVLRGISAGIPLDLSLRLGVGNLLPGTSLAKRSEANRGRETAEVFGPVGGVVEGVGSAISALAKGDTRAAALEAMPVAMANAYKGLEMWTSGVYKDTKGRKITDVSHSDAFIKFLGFNPNTVAVESRQVSTAYDDIALQRIVESSIADKWVRGILEGDQLLIREAHQERLEWNQKNPNLRVVITASQIKRRVKEARLSRQQRFISRVPREMRGNIATQIQ